jgi:hypothetical protein
MRFSAHSFNNAAFPPVTDMSRGRFLALLWSRARMPSLQKRPRLG